MSAYRIIVRLLNVLCVLGMYCAEVGHTEPLVEEKQLGQLSQVDQLLEQFTGNEWTQVRKAKLALENLQGLAIPRVIAILDRRQKVELTNTFDLIYPGAKRFYGHGGVLNYDIDWLQDRAGWLLEALTFQGFGFEAKGNGFATMWESLPAAERERLEKERRAASVAAAARAIAWWKEHNEGWSRLAALMTALRSNEPDRQAHALQWLRLGETSCDGLTKEFYEAKIRPLVLELAKSKNESVRHDAELLLSDAEYYWLSLKPIPAMDAE